MWAELDRASAGLRSSPRRSLLATALLGVALSAPAAKPIELAPSRARKWLRP